MKNRGLLNKNLIVRIITCVILIGFLGLFPSCQKQYINIHAFENDQWEKEDSVSFYFNINDSLKTYDLSFFFRNTLEYQYRNLFLLIDLTYNGQVIQTDTVEYKITNKYGQWLGRGLGGIKDNYFVLNKHFRFNREGDYVISVRHGMRNEPLKGPNKLGFKIK